MFVAFFRLPKSFHVRMIEVYDFLIFRPKYANFIDSYLAATVFYSRKFDIFCGYIVQFNRSLPKLTFLTMMILHRA
jgi:hypothetical protein